MNSKSHRKPKTIFVAGTGTDVGKTYVASLLARYLVDSGRSVGVYKPVASGCEESAEGVLSCGDAERIWQAANRPLTLADVCPQKFKAALAPPEAAKLEGMSVDPDKLISSFEPWLDSQFDVSIIEGAGGLFSPIADDLLNIDLAKTLRPDKVIVVAADRLGVIHDAIATSRAASNSNLKIDGYVLSQPDDQCDRSTQTNADQVAQNVNAPVLASIPHGAGSDAMSFVESWINGRC